MRNINKGLLASLLVATMALAGCDNSDTKQSDEKVLRVGTFGVSIGFSYKQNGKTTKVTILRPLMPWLKN